MDITYTTSTLHRMLRLSACVLIGLGVLTACGRDPQVAAGPGIASAAAPVAAYVSPEQADRAAMVAVQAEHASADALSHRTAPKATPVAYVSPEQADRTAILEARAQRADALARRADLDLTSALARPVVVEQSSAPGSADALEHWALSESGS